MEKHSVNLIIKKEKVSPLVAKLKIILPVTASAFFFIFLVSFFASLFYISKNINEFDRIKSQISKLEKQIADKKNVEGVYTLTLSRAKILEQLKMGNKNYANLLSEILKLQSEGIIINQTSIDKKNSVSTSITASSSALLDDLVTRLEASDKAKNFTDIRTSGIVRDKKGRYLLSIFFKPANKIIE